MKDAVLMLGKKKLRQQKPVGDATVGSVKNHSSVRSRIVTSLRFIASAARRHVVLSIAIGLLLICTGIFLASRQDAPEPIVKTGLDYDADYRKKLIEDSGHTADYGDYLILGKQALEQKNYNDAERYFKDAEQLRSDDVDVLYALATIYRLKEDKPKATSYYDKVISKATPKESPYNSNLALYEAEKRAIEAGNYTLDGVMPEGFDAL